MVVSMTKDEALKLALEALELHGKQYPHMVKGYCLDAITAIKEALAQPEFIKHEVKNADDWSEWVCPDPKNYLMKCCDCGLVHEAEFGVVRYKSETEREDCDMVDDPNLQAVFRMRRSEEWTPEDTAHRSGGLPMSQPEPEYLAFMDTPQRTWVGLTEWEREAIAHECGAMSADWLVFMEAVEKALKEKNT
jgi:hypothetical protein